MKNEKLFRFILSIAGDYGPRIAADVDFGFVITNANGEVVFDAKKSVKAEDFVPDASGSMQVTVDLLVSEISEGSAATGKIVVKLFYEGEEIDGFEWKLERGLPVKEEPFETLTFSGNGVGAVAGIDLPYGTYNIVFTHEGDGIFEVEMNGRSIFRNGIWGTTRYVYQLKPDEDMYYEGTPLKNAVFNIVSASGPWTMTIERADMSDEGRTYEDGITYSGSGIGYVKDIYLPHGTYNVFITHTGMGMFDIELNGKSFLRKSGKLSYVYTIGPDDGLYYSGTPMPSAYFNITDADGDWTITITCVK